MDHHVPNMLDYDAKNSFKCPAIKLADGLIDQLFISLSSRRSMSIISSNAGYSPKIILRISI